MLDGTQLVVNLLTIIGMMVAGFGFLYSKMKGFIEKTIENMLKPVTDSIADLGSRIDKVDNGMNERLDHVDAEISKRLNKVDMQACKNFLVRCLSDLERGDALGEVEKERFKEQYDYYIDHDGNSYIKDKVEKYKAEGKL